MRVWIVLAGTIGLMTFGHATMSAQSKPDAAVVGRVAVTAKGMVSFNGAVITMDALKDKLADLTKRNGAVWYYREAATEAPPAQAMQVMQLIIDSRIPVSISTKPDFSDVLLPDGTTRPRAGVPPR